MSTTTMTGTIAGVLKLSAGQTLGAMAGFLAKAGEHAKSIEVDESVFMAARLSPDMFPMSRQVQIACDITARGSARLAGAPIPEHPDTETSFAELAERCHKALGAVMGLDDAALNASGDKTITFPARRGEMSMPGLRYLSNFILPNLHFHAATAYGLLRMQGVPLGKGDFLMPPGESF